MSFYEFNPEEVFVNTVRTHPSNEFFIYAGQVYYNSEPQISGTAWGARSHAGPGLGTPPNYNNVPQGHANLYEYNINRLSVRTQEPLDPASNSNRLRVITAKHLGGGLHGKPSDSAADAVEESGPPVPTSDIRGKYVIDNGMIYPFITKANTLTAWKTVSTLSFNAGYEFGDVISSSYPMSASITRKYFSAGDVTPLEASTRALHRTTIRLAEDTGIGVNKISSLRNLFNYYSTVSPHYEYNGAYGNKTQQPAGLISVPSIFYGSEIKKGTVSLKFYITGTLIGELVDENRNGELIQVGPAGSGGSGSVAGVVLYKEGFIYLTGSWNIDENSLETYPYNASSRPKWVYFGFGSNEKDASIPDNDKSSFSISFSGSQDIQTVTMLAHAKRGEVNFSPNVTFVASGSQKLLLTSSAQYYENDLRVIKNTTTSSHADLGGEFKRQVYISKIGIYDKDRNLIGITTLSRPIRKPSERQLTFKLKLDI